MSVAEEFSIFCERTEVIAVLDHSGRAGNTFFVTIFDGHPEVIANPLAHYFYSHFVATFGDADELDSRTAHQFASKAWYFRVVYGTLDNGNASLVHKFGGDPEAPVDRPALSRVFDEIVLACPTISRRNLLLACYFAYAIGIGRDIGKIKYILIDDAITLRTETPFTGFSGRIVDSVVGDFPSARLVHLIRDPRAAFASTNHQFVNALGNEYGIHWGNYRRNLRRLWAGEPGWDGVFIFGFLLLFFHQAFLAIERKKTQYPQNFMLVRNEDLNLRFVGAMQSVCERLGIGFLEEWRNPNYVPTMVGRPWRGMGAYNNAYQTQRFGPLENEPDAVSRKIAGPNRHVTERWRNRLSRREIFIIEWFLRSELTRYDYPFLELRDQNAAVACLFRSLALPLQGELPTLKWVLRGRRVSLREVFDRMFFTLSFLPFYIGSRLMMLRFIREPVLAKR